MQQKAPPYENDGVICVDLCLVDADLFAVFAVTLKLDFTVDKSIQSVIGADADIVAGMDMRTALTDEDGACKNCLAIASLRAESLGFGIKTVTGGAHSLFMSKKLNVNLKRCYTSVVILIAFGYCSASCSICKRNPARRSEALLFPSETIQCR